MRLLAPLVVCLMVGTPALADGPTISPSDTTQSVIAAQKGKKVTVRLGSGDELTGTVKASTDRLLVLESLSGREFFDAVVPMDAVQAVIIRARQ